MSDNSTLTALQQEIAASYSQGLVSGYTLLSAAALLLYDYILTFPLELAHIWRGQFNLTKFFFVLNRYSSFLVIYGSLLGDFVKPVSDTDCLAFYYIQAISNTLFATAINSIFVLRMFAVYGKSWTVFFLLAIPGIVNVASTVWDIIDETASAYPQQLQVVPFTCSAASTSSVDASFLFNIISTAVFDLLVIILTVYRTARLAIHAKKYNLAESLSFILLRDGIFYYLASFVPACVIAVLNGIALNSSNINVDFAGIDLTNILAVLQMVVVNRLILNLSHVANTREDSESRTSSGFETLAFARNSMIGNIGAPVRTYLDDLEENTANDEERDSTGDMHSGQKECNTVALEKDVGSRFEQGLEV